MPENCSTNAPIAIIGTGCRFPGGVRGAGQFWDLLRSGGHVIGEIPPGRWDVEEYYDPDPKKRGTMYTKWGGFLDDVDKFEPAFFGIAPREAREMDPQQRLLLEVSWEALEDAAQVPAALTGSRTAVYTGIIGVDYLLHHAQRRGVAGIDAWYACGKEFSFGPGRLSYVLGLHGPSMSVSTACSSSLVAVDLACRSLRDGRADLALAGGVNLMLSPELTIFMCKTRAMSPTGRCRPFDVAADGIVRGEGCAMVVLKRLGDALADDDDVLAVIRGSAVNHGGASAGITAPNMVAQQALLAQAAAEAGVTPEDISFVEAHGTGTPLGDPIEIASMRSVLGDGRPDDRPLLIGSHKANLGHMDSAAGIAGLIKTALVLKHGVVPPQINLESPNPVISWDWPVRIPADETPLAAGDGPLLAGVSAFGLSGTNAHVILEAPPRRTEQRFIRPAVTVTSPDDGPVLIPLSARTAPALTELAAAYRTVLAADPAMRMADVARTAGRGRTHYRAHRLAFVVRSREELVSRLGEFLDGGEAPGLFHGGANGSARVVFVFPGGTAAWPRWPELFENEQAFQLTLVECDALLRRRTGSSVADELGTSGGEPLSPAAVFALQAALTALLRSYGITPDVAVGEGPGAATAAWAEGRLSLETAAGRLASSRKESLPVESRIAELRDSGHRVFQIVGPADSRDEASVREAAGGEATVLSSLPAEGDLASLLESLAALYAAGIDLRWQSVPPRGGRLAKLPTYPWQRDSYWISP